jgi:formylglycine-generating enzyme required for sulfatase activity
MKDEESKDTGRDVFISYATDKDDSHASRDRQAADRVYAALEAEGIRCWAAHYDIVPGDDWLEAIINAVEKSKVLVLVFSSNANHSEWVQDEIKLALEEKIKIIPFRIEDVSPQGGLKILKVRCQWLDAFTPPIEEHIGKLVKVVCRHLGKEPKISEKSKVNEKPEAPEEEMPEEVKSLKSKAQKIYKNEKGYWEADYGDGIIMVYIPEGEFTMGSNDYASEKPIHTVYLDGYWMGRNEVTFDQYDKYCEETKKKKPSGIGWGRGNRPVIHVSWDDAVEYCKWLSNEKGLKFKLPTEAQWEKVARGTDSRMYPWGNGEPDETLANFNRKIVKTSPVGSYPKGASPYGLLDMAGNVWEWCNDWYGIDYYKKSPKKNPTGPESGTGRVLRGGGWGNNAGYIRCANRGNYDPSRRYTDVGFRLCQDKN